MLISCSMLMEAAVHLGEPQTLAVRPNEGTQLGGRRDDAAGASNGYVSLTNDICCIMSKPRKSVGFYDLVIWYVLFSFKSIERITC